MLDALERGINYFDTAESYRGGDSEITIGNALRGKRDKVFIASKTHTSATETSDSMMRSLEASLRRLQTDYVDVYFTHAVNSVGRLENPQWHEFVEQAKKQGKDPLLGPVRSRGPPHPVPGLCPGPGHGGRHPRGL